MEEQHSYCCVINLIRICALGPGPYLNMHVDQTNSSNPLSQDRRHWAHFICSPHLAASENCQWRRCVWGNKFDLFQITVERKKL